MLSYNLPDELFVHVSLGRHVCPNWSMEETCMNFAYMFYCELWYSLCSVKVIDVITDHNTLSMLPVFIRTENVWLSTTLGLFNSSLLPCFCFLYNYKGVDRSPVLIPPIYLL